MKYILFLAAITFASAISAQNNNSPWVKKKPVFLNPNLPKFDALKKNDALKNQFGLAVLPQAKLLRTLPNGNKVYALPEDHMPCIVPNMNAFTIPNKSAITIQPFRYNGPGAIPNPAQPMMKESDATKRSLPRQQIEIISTKNQKPRL